MNQRPTKVQKFRHPLFRKDCRDILTAATKRGETQGKRKMLENEKPQRNATRSAEEENQERNLMQKSKRPRKLSFDSGDETASTATKEREKLEIAAKFLRLSRSKRVLLPQVFQSVRKRPAKCAESTAQKK